MPQSSPGIIGVIGVGLLGSALCHRLRRAGYHVIGYDTQAKQLEYLLHIGGRAAGSVEEIAKSSTTILLSLPDSGISKTVCTNLMAYTSRNSTIIDTTTGAPEDAISNSALLETKGIQFLDATVAGSSSQVHDGEGVMMVGGNKEVFNQCSQILDDLCGRTFYVGPTGSGARVKLIVNLAIGLNRAVLAETLALADASSINLQTALEVLKATPAYSAAMDIKGEKMIARDFTPQARLRQHRKDVELIRNLAEQHNQKLPLSDLHATILDTAINAGLGDLDNSAIYKVIRDNLS